MSASSRPQPGEYNPYYERYISLVESADICASLTRQGQETVALLSGIGEERGGFRYAPDKWSIKEMLGHVDRGIRGGTAVDVAAVRESAG
jgi:hypothetical protein